MTPAVRHFLQPLNLAGLSTLVAVGLTLRWLPPQREWLAMALLLAGLAVAAVSVAAAVPVPETSAEIVPFRPPVRPAVERAMEIARRLEAHAKVAKVVYPGLASHPQHALAMKQQSGIGGAVLSFDVKAANPEQARQRAFHVLDSLRVLSLSTNLGDTKTLCAHPASTSHGRLTEAQRQAAGIGQGLIRVAVGLEHLDDLKADLSRGLDTL